MPKIESWKNLFKGKSMSEDNEKKLKRTFFVQPTDYPANLYISEYVLDATLQHLRNAGLRNVEGYVVWYGLLLHYGYKTSRQDNRLDNEISNGYVYKAVFIPHNNSDGEHTSITAHIQEYLQSKLSEFWDQQIPIFPLAVIHSHPNDQVISGLDVISLRSLGKGIYFMILPRYVEYTFKLNFLTSVFTYILDNNNNPKRIEYELLKNHFILKSHDQICEIIDSFQKNTLFKFTKEIQPIIKIARDDIKDFELIPSKEIKPISPGLIKIIRKEDDSYHENERKDEIEKSKIEQESSNFNEKPLTANMNTPVINNPMQSNEGEPNKGDSGLDPLEYVNTNQDNDDKKLEKSPGLAPLDKKKILISSYLGDVSIFVYPNTSIRDVVDAYANIVERPLSLFINMTLIASGKNIFENYDTEIFPRVVDGDFLIFKD